MAKGTNAYKVFVVDDDMKVLTMVNHYLQNNSEFNLNVQTFVTAEEAISKMSEHPDVVILDYLLEGEMNGMDVMNKIKEDYSDSEVIMISGQDNMETALETIRHGAFDYVIKNETAIMRTQMTVDKILTIKIQQGEIKSYKKGMRLLIILLSIFVLGMAAVIVVATT